MNKEEFCQRFSEVQDELYRVAFIYLKNREDAKDVVQETAYRCYKNIGRLKNEEYFNTWAVRTGINCSLDILRKKKHAVNIIQEIPDDDLNSSAADTAEARIFLEKLMFELSDREKTVVIMRHMYGFSLNDIAKSLKIPLSTVKSTLYRAMDKLKKEGHIYEQ